MLLQNISILILLVVAAHGYPAGAPQGACDAMTPNHGVSAQTDASNYTITPSASTYDCGDTITVTLTGGSFKGFLCQARPDANTYSTVGTLTDTDSSVTTTSNCGAGGALTHTERSDKSTFQFSWTHSGTSTSDVYIVCTVVQEKATYWVKLNSTAITYSGAATACSGAAKLLVPIILLCTCVIFSMIKSFMQ